MQRRKFLQSAIGVTALPFILNGCKSTNAIKGSIVGASAARGHKLRDIVRGEPVETIRNELVIAGGGISGLAAAREVRKSGINDFLLLELESRAGGNAAWGANNISSFPWGAHYIPIPNNNLPEYLDFLSEAGVITGRDNYGNPIYNDYHLCFDPQERLYINGRWQDGLVPQFGVPDNDKKQLDRFLSQMHLFKEAKGKDGKEAFAIPVDQSSKDEAYTKLDNISMAQWLRAEGYASDYLHWYVNYCTRDDFGTPHDKVSAWAGIHYFASRKGRGANATYDDVLTWPEGNGWLVRQLAKNLDRHIHTDCLVTEVKIQDDGVAIIYLDARQDKLKKIITKQCVMAMPQFIAARLLKQEDRLQKAREHLQYAPWMVANLVVNGLEERSGAPKSWDNVLFDSQSLGYVDATHELLEQRRPQRNLTYYLPLTSDSPANERKKAQALQHEDWVRMIFSDLRRIHPNIEQATEEVNIMIWGHAMAQPLPGLIHGGIRHELSQSIEDKIHFAHTDLAGISIFEEAFYQGLYAAKKVIKKLAR